MTESLKRPKRLILPLRTAVAALAIAGCAAVVFASAHQVRAQDANPVLAKVNGVDVRQSDLNMAEEELGSGQLAQMDAATKRENLLSYVIDLKIVAKAAEDKKLGDTDAFKKSLAFARDRLLMDKLLTDEAKAATTEAAMRKVYEEAASQMGGDEEVRARHILVENEAEAKQVIDELKKGGDFAEIAKKKSKDPGAQDGGDLGYFTKEQMVPEFSKVAFEIEPGKISDPVKSQFGWHVIKVEDKRKRKPPEFDQVKPQIETYVTRKAQADLVAKLRESAKVERIETKSDAAPAAKDASPPAKGGAMAPAKK
jgi:peptidyl-prolyl cis-trans isomerase C